MLAKSVDVDGDVAAVAAMVDTGGDADCSHPAVNASAHAAMRIGGIFMAYAKLLATAAATRLFASQSFPRTSTAAD